MSTGGNANRQHNPNQKGGGQVHGGPPKSRLHQPPRFQGKSGTPDNQSTSRGKGKT